MSGQWWENDLIVGPFADIPAANAWAAANPSSLFPGLLATAGGAQIRWGGVGVGWGAAKSMRPILLLSESILAVANFPAKLAAKTGLAVDSSYAVGGSHIGIGLAAVAEESYSLAYGDNACAYSDDLTAAGWSQINAGECTIAVNYIGGEKWSKITKTTAAVGAGARYVTAIPAAGDGIIASFEVKTLTPDIKVESISINIRRMDTLASVATAIGNIKFAADASSIITAHIPPSLASSLFGTGINIAIEVRLNDTVINSVAYIRNVTLSFKNPYGFAPLVKTSGAAVVGSLGWVKHTQQSCKYSRYSAAVCSFGRNESNAYVPAQSHGNAYRSLIRAAKRIAPVVVPTNPPCQVYSNAWDEKSYFDSYKEEFRKIVSDVGSGFDVQSAIQAFPPADVMSIVSGFSQHENEAGADWMVDVIANLINAGKTVPTVGSTNPVRVYWDGVRGGSGTWVQKYGTKIRMNRASDTYSITGQTGADYPALGASNSSAGGTLTYTVGDCQQVHVLMDHGVGLGTFAVSVDGIVVANIDSANASVATPYMIAKFACDGIQSATSHTVVITVLSGDVRIYGIVTV